MTAARSDETGSVREVRLSKGRVSGVQRLREGAAWAREGGDVKRRFLIIAIFLLAGAVAWGCVTWAPPDQALTFFDVFPEEYGPILRQSPGGPWTVVGTGKRYSGIGVHLERPPW